jgi:NAD-dependent protein deacetylase/lipoamidase
MKNYVILSGAGLSAESGLATFRDSGGLWEGHDLMAVATPEAFARDPDLVQRFYNERRAGLLGAKPNAAHKALAKFEQEIAARNGSVLLVTQNVDDLLERAGAKNILHMHGELFKIRCTTCTDSFTWQQDLSTQTPCPSCKTPALRPAIVWFGEMPLYMEEIEHALQRADIFISIGTSGSVYPAAGFVDMARMRNIPCVELNLEPSDNHHVFTKAIYGPAGDIVPHWVAEELNE